MIKRETINTASWEEYLSRFDEILNQDTPVPPYDDEDFINYVRLNQSRVHRWLKNSTLLSETEKQLKNIQEKQQWYLILEPWCGDAAHIAPFLYLMSQENPLIQLSIVWRDTEPLMIDDYLTNGGKSIPKLVVRNSADEDLFTWGPRPKEAQDLYMNLKEKGAEFEDTKVALQKWYNEDKGKMIQEEITALLSAN